MWSQHERCFEMHFAYTYPMDKFHHLFYKKTDKKIQDAFVLKYMSTNEVKSLRVDEINAKYAQSRGSTKYFVWNEK